MNEEQINTLAKYLGCKCSHGSYAGILFNVNILSALPTNNIYKNMRWFKLHLFPLSSLTQKDFERMFSEIRYDVNCDLERWLTKFVTRDHLIFVKEADWLRNNGYYLGEECIKEFVKLK